MEHVVQVLYSVYLIGSFLTKTRSKQHHHHHRQHHHQTLNTLFSPLVSSNRLISSNPLIISASSRFARRPHHSRIHGKSDSPPANIPMTPATPTQRQSPP